MAADEDSLRKAQGLLLPNDLPYGVQQLLAGSVTVEQISKTGSLNGISVNSDAALRIDAKDRWVRAVLEKQ
jgi:hypothetical protein